MAEGAGLLQQAPLNQGSKGCASQASNLEPAPVPTVGKVWASPPDKCLLSRQCQGSKGSWVPAAANMKSTWATYGPQAHNR